MLKIRKILKSSRKERGLKQADVAKILNISIASYSKMETGATDLSLPRLFQLSEIFDINIVDLLAQIELGNYYDGFQTPAMKEIELKDQIIAQKNVEIALLQKKLIKLYEGDLNYIGK